MSEEDGSTIGTKFTIVSKCDRSKFRWKDFLDLNVPARSHNTPLAVMVHVDVNAFFAQAEQLRLGLSSKDPVVCVQWSSLIAVSYAARKFGIGRMDSLESAKKKCPNVVPAHTAVFKKGESHWVYHDAGVLPNSETHKVSLDPYRRESRKMMRMFRSKCDMVEKASVDESFMDLGRLIFTKARELFPILNLSPSNDAEFLPSVPENLPEGCHFEGEVIHNDDEGKSSMERILFDWDDVFIMIGSQISHDIRRCIEEELGYTTSAGISRAKTISKLASGFIKPDAQTVVRASAIPNFCDNFEISDFWSMGGKVGKMIQAKLSTPSERSIRYIRDQFTLDELILRLEPDAALANTLYKMVRGTLFTPLNLRTDVKSMGSTKNFRGDTVSNLKDIYDWMPVFCSDIIQRILELDEETGMLNRGSSRQILRRPKVLSIHFRTSKFQSFSRQRGIPTIESSDKLRELVFKNGCELYDIVANTWNETMNGKLFPLSNFGISVSNFEEFDNSQRIDQFAMSSNGNQADAINSLFAELESETQKSSPKKQQNSKGRSKYDIFSQVGSSRKRLASPEEVDHPRYCKDCEKVVDEDIASHRDYHFALALSKEYHNEDQTTRSTPTKDNYFQGSRKKKKKALDKGQSTLPF